MFSIDLRDRRPIYEQLIGHVEDMALLGLLAPDAPLPSVRQLAGELSINPNTIQRAYQELERRGVIYSVKGKGSFISPDCAQLAQRKLCQFDQQLVSLLNQGRLLGLKAADFQARIQQYYQRIEGGDEA